MKRYKKEYGDILEVGQTFYTKRFRLTVDRNLCKGCVICKLACPREAITIKPPAGGSDGETPGGEMSQGNTPGGDTPLGATSLGTGLAPIIDIDESKCDFHGICAVVCPFSAIKITIDGSDDIPAVVKGVFPVLTRDIDIDVSKCEASCNKCEDACPLGIISVEPTASTVASTTASPAASTAASTTTSTVASNTASPAAPPTASPAASPSAPITDQAVVSVDKDLCAGCRACWSECPTDAVKVTRFYEGSIRIDKELCPPGCRRCMDVCPLDALYVGDDNKVDVKNSNCIYCGACQNVCPAREALEISRTSVRHSPIESGAWNKGLERITSTDALNKELAASRTAKIREAVNEVKGI